MNAEEKIKVLRHLRNSLDTLADRPLKEALDDAIEALKKQERERWRRYPDEKPDGQDIVLATMPAYTDRNGVEYVYGGVICAYHFDSWDGGWWARSDGVTYGALGTCDTDPVAWRPMPEGYQEDQDGE